MDKIYTTGASTGTESTYFNYNLNEWVDIVIHWKLDPVNGYLEIWVNGDKVVDETVSIDNETSKWNPFSTKKSFVSIAILP